MKSLNSWEFQYKALTLSGAKFLTAASFLYIISVGQEIDCYHLIFQSRLFLQWPK